MEGKEEIVGRGIKNGTGVSTKGCTNNEKELQELLKKGERRKERKEAVEKIKNAVGGMVKEFEE